ncbi:putative arsenite S-adenosylmethyltransferase, partial [Paenibacillus agaridevorans]
SSVFVTHQLIKYYDCGSIKSLLPFSIKTSVHTLIYDSIKKMLWTNIIVESKVESRDFITDWVPGQNIANYIQSAVIKATK